MKKQLLFIAGFVSLLLITSCATVTVPMAPKSHDIELKKFNLPNKNKAGLYIYRNTLGGGTLKKPLFVDNKLIGETANKVYFHFILDPGSHTISTVPDFNRHSVRFIAEGGKNYFAEQYIEMGPTVGGSGIEMVSEDKGKSQVLKCELATYNPKLKENKKGN